ncbi:TatD family hydrolase [Lentibacillus halophilus]|uniref:TatD family hydrolase n=1 Tax=Lentibacillus halophilus TaxID=295065 RepID=A0ABN0Z9Y5_9BACI
MSDRIIDAHIHLDRYAPDDRSLILNNMNDNGVDALVSVSGDLDSAQKNLQMSRDDSRVKPAIGFHPEQELPTDEDVADLLALMDRHRYDMVAVGEIGLPYYLEQEGRIASREAYMEVLEAFIQKAVELDKPIALHAVFDDAPMVCDLLETYSTSKAHFHWFKGDWRTTERMYRNGYLVSVTPDILYKTKTRNLAATYPLEKLMVETDGPWPFEGTFKGKMTHPAMIHQSVQEVAALKQMSVGEVYDELYNNTCHFYELNTG